MVGLQDDLCHVIEPATKAIPRIHGLQDELAQASQLFEEKIRDLSIAHRIGDSLKYARDVRRVFETIIDTILEETNAENCSLMLLNRETGELAVKAARGQTDAAVSYYPLTHNSRSSFRLGEGIAGWVAQHGRAASIPDISWDSRFVVASRAAGPIASLLCLPLIIEDNVVGVLNLSHPRRRAFSAEDERLMAFIADQVSVALSSVQVFDEMQRLNEALRTEVDRATEELRRANSDLKTEIAERRRVEERLREREKELKDLNTGLEERVRQRTFELQVLYERMDGLVERLPEGVCLLDAEQRLIVANPSVREYLKALGQAAEVGDLVSCIGGRAVEEILAPRPDGLAHEVTPEGSQRVFEVEARPVAEGRAEGGWVLVMREVTQERELQERMQQQDRLAAVGQLAAGIAHDFNNLLMGIIGFSELLEMQEDLTDSAKGHLKTISSQGKRAAQLIRQILDFSRKTVVERQPVDLAPFLKEVVKLLDRTLPETIRLVTGFGPENCVIQASLTQLQQVITNLAVNARDAMPEGGELRIGLSSLMVAEGERPPLPEMGPGDWVVWTVSDTGTGMPPEVIAHIFEPFFTTKKVGKGTGLGLAQVYGIVKQHGGEIGVESQVGKGTTFTIYLPKVVKTHATPQQADADIPKGQGETIMVVEDEMVVCQAVASMLKHLGYRVLTAGNGQEALTTYDSRRDEVDLVLTDMVMPEMGGMDLLEALKQRDPGVRVVMMTGYPLRGEGRTQVPQGIMGYLEKPVGPKQMAQAMREALTKMP